MNNTSTRRLLNALTRKKTQFCNWSSTVYTKTKMRLLNVSIGKGCKFYGNCHITVCNNASVKIGNLCRFRSRWSSNNIGLNHPCMISAEATDKQKGCEISIGNNCGFSGVSIWCFEKIMIGNNVRVGANSLIMDGDAHFEDCRTSPPAAIHIEDNVFIGANCSIKKGVTIGENSIIGMNSVVTKSIPANCVAVGTPAKVIKKLTE